LDPDGSILLDVNSLKAFEKRQENAIYELNQLNGFWSAGKYYGFVNTFKYEREKVSLDKYTIVEAGRRRTVYNWFQYFSPEALEKEFADNGLTVSELYSDVAGSPFDAEADEFAVVARKS
jgi:hypothetical protein